MSSTTRSSLPILPTTILTAVTSQSNLSAQECQKSDTWLSTCLLPSLSLSPSHWTPHTKTHFTQSSAAHCLLLQPLYTLLAQAACTELRLQRVRGENSDEKSSTTPLRSLRLPLHYWRPSAAHSSSSSLYPSLHPSLAEHGFCRYHPGCYPPPLLLLQLTPHLIMLPSRIAAS